MVEEIVDEVVCTIEPIANDSWVTWVGQLVPNIVHCI